MGHKTFLLSNIQGLQGAGGRSKAGFLHDQAILCNSLVVAVTETWLKPEVKDSEVLVKFPGYTLFRSDRVNRSRGGVCIFLREDISAECIGTYDDGVCELLVLKVHSLNTIISVVYRPPDTRHQEFSSMLRELDRILSEQPPPSPTFVLLGDLNFPSKDLQWQNVDDCLLPVVHSHREVSDPAADGLKVRQQAQLLCDMMLRHHMVQYVDQVTHGKEILDLCFSSDPQLISHIKSEYFPLFTDHNIVTINVNYLLEQKPVKDEMTLLDSACRLRKLDFNKAPWQIIRQELAKLSWSTMSSLAMTSSTLAHSWFLHQIIPVLERLVPVKRAGGQGRNRLHRKRKLLWRRLDRIKTQLGRSTSVKKLAKLLQDRQQLESDLKFMYEDIAAKQEAKVISDMKENPKAFFSFAKSRQKTHAKVGPFLDPSTGKLNLDPDYTAECLSKQYSSVFTQPRPEWTIPDMKEFFEVDSSRPTGPILTDLEFTESDIEYACMELSASSASGPDGIPAELLKTCRKELKKPLYIMWRASMSQGIIPPDLLLVLISPIHKGGSRADHAKYRPVALTSHLIKVFERVIRKSLVNHLEALDLLPDNQHGFRQLRSTLTQLLTHWDSVLDSLEHGESVDVIYTDFSKAFDKCETNVLLHTVRDCRVMGRVGVWISAFLDPLTRKQAVGVDGRMSELTPIVSGVPQGTVLGPVLFLIHIRNISSSLSDGTNSASFADDTKIWRGVKTPDDCAQLQEDLQSVYGWAENINMMFNSDKFEWIRYSLTPESAPKFQYLSPDSSIIEQKDNLRDLGVRLSSDLSFNLHIEKAVTTASQMVGWAMRSFRTRGSHILLTTLKSLVQPHLDYCCQLWCPSTQYEINRIEKVQRSLISRISDQRLIGADYWQKLKLLRVYSQERRRERYAVMFLWKLSQGLVTGYDIDFTPCDSRIGRKAVSANVPRTPASFKNATEGSLSVKGVALFNSLPITLRNSNHGDTAMFKNHLDIYLGNIPDQPTVAGLTRGAQSNSLLHQIPMYEVSLM